ncbi:hypothetical protein KJ611_02345 [Patescibacteria group bacterium]|nr:hypothetical protein [Patescibacteria group bacterium]MBU1705692.1 hypothetical protein [Patescibacteria group bacterium]
MAEEGLQPAQPELIQQAETGLQEAEAEFKQFYKFSLWWVNNKEKLKKIAYGLAIAAEGGLILFVLWTMIDSFLVSYGQEQRSVGEMVAFGQSDLNTYTVAHAAQPLTFSGTGALAAGAGRYDFYAALNNPNPEWWAEVVYKFTATAFETEEQRGFILPGEEKPIIVFAQLMTTAPRSVNFELVEVNWHRVDRHAVGNYDLWYRDRMSFEIRDLAVEKDLEVDTKMINRVSFTVENRGAYSFYDPEFIILLRRGTSVVGVNSITLSSLAAGETQNVVANWFDSMPASSKVEILPNINLFDQRVYKILE